MKMLWIYLFKILIL